MKREKEKEKKGKREREEGEQRTEGCDRGESKKQRDTIESKIRNSFLMS